MKLRLLLFLVLMPLTLIAVFSTLVWAQCWAFMPAINLVIGVFERVCPVASEEARYPADVDILIPARQTPDSYIESRVKVLPGGHHIIYEPEAYERYRLYTLDTKEDSEIVFPESVDSIETYLTDEWMVVGHYTKSPQPNNWTYSLFNRITGTMLAMNHINTEAYLARGIPSNLQPLIQAHPLVYLHKGDLILIPTYVGDPNATATHIAGYMDYPHPQATAEIIAVLQAIGVEPLNLERLEFPDQTLRIQLSSYTTALSESPATWEPETWTFSASIVEVQSGKTVLTSSLDYFEPIGWAAEQRGIVMLSPTRKCAIHIPLLWCVYSTAHPIVLQRQNAAYLTASQQAAFAAQDAQEATAKQNARPLMVILLVASGALGVATPGTALYPSRRETVTAQTESPAPSQPSA